MIKDWNTQNIKEVFHFKNSLRPFISVDSTSGDFCFLDLNERKVYTYNDLIEYEGLEFYKDDDNHVFMGVEIAEK